MAIHRLMDGMESISDLLERAEVVILMAGLGGDGVRSF